MKGMRITSPEFQPSAAYTSDTVQASMRVDQGSGTHPLRFPELPANWMGIFDTISYSKGSSLLRMIEGFLTEPVLITGLKEFLNRRYDSCDNSPMRIRTLSFEILKGLQRR